MTLKRQCVRRLQETMQNCRGRKQRPTVLQSTRKRRRDKEETHKEILFSELFTTVATVMQYFYDQKIRPSDVEREVQQYIRKIYEDHSGVWYDSKYWETISNICARVLRYRDGSMRDVDRIIDEWVFVESPTVCQMQTFACRCRAHS